MRAVAWSFAALAALAGSSTAAEAPGVPPTVVVGSKAFTESVILGEMVAQLARSAGAEVVQRRALGGSRVLWNALLAGDIDVYPEYTGTLRNEILAGTALAGSDALRAALARRGVRMSAPLGFDNTYAIGMKQSLAEEMGIRTVSDLRAHPTLRLGFSNEFLERQDGWPGLRNRYGLPQKNVRGLDHDLAYRGLQQGTLQATDLYTTDPEIRYYALRVLADDLGYFPHYRAMLLYRADLARRAPDALRAIRRLEGRVSQSEMIALNARAKLERMPEVRVAADFLRDALGVTTRARVEGLPWRVLRRTREHLTLVGVSLGAALLIAVPLGVVAARRPRWGQIILGAAGVVQTVPSLALLVFMIPFLGVGGRPAVVALFLYSLLPIIRNTFVGLCDIAPEIHESAQALGLPPGARLRLVELPLATRAILAGIKTSAVINVGTATLGALIGAGGYGQPILTGIRLDDMGLILEGAIPAALLALGVQAGFEMVERVAVPKGLRLQVTGQ